MYSMFNSHYSLSQSISTFMYKVYGWMTVGLAITAATAYATFANQAFFMRIYSSPGLLILLFLAQIALVIALSGFVMRMSLAVATLCFAGYSVLMGITMAGIFAVYSVNTIYLAFGVAALMFVTMAIYGYFTKQDLTSVGSLMIMGLVGIIIASLLNLYFRNEMLDYVISFLGVGIFTVLIAYDSQKIKQLGYMLLGQGEAASKVALLGALTLYLDFINLFIFLLRIFGSQKRQE